MVPPPKGLVKACELPPPNGCVVVEPNGDADVATPPPNGVGAGALPLEKGEGADKGALPLENGDAAGAAALGPKGDGIGPVLGAEVDIPPEKGPVAAGAATFIDVFCPPEDEPLNELKLEDDVVAAPEKGDGVTVEPPPENGFVVDEVAGANGFEGGLPAGCCGSRPW